MIVYIVIPTFNEAKNIEKLIKELFLLYPRSYIIVVDDNSPDGTAKIVTKLHSKYKNLDLIKRELKNGRGSAVQEGFRRAFKNKSCKTFIEMDADFSHRPSDIRQIILHSSSYDVVVGSRYSTYSKISGWGIGRKVFSKLANILCRKILGIPISDYTNGFRSYSRKAVSKLLNYNFKTKGYIVLSENAYLLYKDGFTFGEVSTVFKNRVRGKSNFNLKEIIESVIGIIKIRVNI